MYHVHAYHYEGKDGVAAVAVGCINYYKEPIKNNENWCKLARENVLQDKVPAQP